MTCAIVCIALTVSDSAINQLQRNQKWKTDKMQ